MNQPITQNEELLKRIVIVLGVLLVLGTIGLVIGIILKPSEEQPPAPAPTFGNMPAEAPFELPPLKGREIVDTSIEGANMMLRLRDATGAQEIWVVDMASGEVIRKFAFTEDP